MCFSGLLSFLLPSILSPCPPPQSPLGPVGEPEGFACSSQVNDGSNDEEGCDNNPEGESDPVTGLAH